MDCGGLGDVCRGFLPVLACTRLEHSSIFPVTFEELTPDRTSRQCNVLGFYGVVFLEDFPRNQSVIYVFFALQKLQSDRCSC